MEIDFNALASDALINTKCSPQERSFYFWVGKAGEIRSSGEFEQAEKSVENFNYCSCFD